MKIKLSSQKKSKLNEVEPVTIAAIAIGSLIFSILAKTLIEYKDAMALLTTFLKGASKSADEGIKEAESAISEIKTTNEVAKKNILEKFQAAKKDLFVTLQELEKTAQKNKGAFTTSEQRPSAIISGKIKILMDIINETRNTFAQELKADQTSANRLKKGNGYIKSAWGRLSSLDLVAAASSKKDQKGLWRSIPQLQTSFKDDNSWVEFAYKVVRSVRKGDENKFKVDKAVAPAPSGA